MNTNEQTIQKFYSAFAELDADTMAACYAQDAVFKDEVFSLEGRHEIGGMWRMLAQATKAKGLDVWRLEFRDVNAGALTGAAHWDAYYRFSATGRMVHNSIDAKFTFNSQGQFATHTDSFDFWLWSRQALGTPGLLLGWTPIIRNKVRATAAGNLHRFLDRS